TFIIDPRVKGKVNVVSSQPLSKDEVVGVFLSIMEVHGFTTVAVGKAIKIIPNAQVRNAPQRVVDNITGGGDEVITHVLPLQYVSAQELAPILRPLMGNNGHLADYAPSNSLIFSDNAANIQRMLDIVKRVDKNTEREIEVIPLQYALGSEIVRLLDKLWPQDSADSSSRISVGVDERSNSILLSGNSGKRLEIRTLISHLDTPVESGGNTQVIYLRYANAENVARILTGLSNSDAAAGTGAAAAADDNSQIQADLESNALVITAPAARFKSLRAVIQKLDMPRAQVHIEAIIAEVSFNTAKELGVEWVVDGSQSTNNTYPIGATNFPDNGGTLAGIVGSILTGSIPTFGSGMSLGVGGTTDGGTRFGALLRALATDSSTNILSTPSLTTLDNQEAEIIVGQNVPFKTGSYTTEGSIGQLNPFTTIKREDVGITLKVKPQINEGDAITMTIEQDISSVSANSASDTDLTTNKRSIKTTVLVANDDMIVLGGLIDEDVQESQSKVPVLGSIPLLGRLFRYDKTTKLKRSLMVFIHPKIISTPSMGHSISQSKYTYLQNEQDKLKDKESRKFEPELAEFPDPPADPVPEQDSTDPDGNPDQQPDDKNQ
ncbi:MAG: type II secretion system secretin GspD, partial [Xanthomonadales bacterium]|nr:type II secretion system secretin GspD [Xanthomonadales bacterium]